MTDYQDELKEMARQIYLRYKSFYNGEVQGCCLLIADEIQRLVGGDVVAGNLTWFGGSCKRSHWWIDKCGLILDPMGDDFLKSEVAVGREEIHRDRDIFTNILPCYEQWRIPTNGGPHV